MTVEGGISRQVKLVRPCCCMGVGYCQLPFWTQTQKEGMPCTPLVYPLFPYSRRGDEIELSTFQRCNPGGRVLAQGLGGWLC